MGRGRFVMVGNRIGRDSVLSRYAERPGIYHTIVNALDKKGNPTWSENYTLDEIKGIREFIGERRFQKEYMNNPLSEGAIFQRKHIKYAKMLPLKEYKMLCSYTDPSFKQSATADYKATILLGKTKDGMIHVLKAYVDQTRHHNMINYHYDIIDYVDGACSGYVLHGGELSTGHYFKRVSQCWCYSRHQIPIRGDNRRKPDKFARIEAISPLFDRGLIFFNIDEKDSSGMITLIEQLLMFEKGSRSHDDGPDALEGGIWMLNRRSMATNLPYSYGKRASRRY
ncbi:MAG: hypothetical protein ACOXZ9_00035 [Bacteroidales bacterium]